MRNSSRSAVALIAGVLHAAFAAAQPPAHSLAASPRTTTERPRSEMPSLDSLVARAISASPTLHAAAARIDAAQARVAPASALPDPMLMLGIINQPLGRMAAVPGEMTPSAAGPDPMTMRMVGVNQSVPYPGKRALLRRSAELDVDVSRATMEVSRRQLTRDVKVSWYEIAFLDEALSIVGRNRSVLTTLISATESRYAAGAAMQQDVLAARIEATRLAETASGLVERRRAEVARLNGLLDQGVETGVPLLAIPEAVVRAAVFTSPNAVRFTSAALGARAADSPLRSVEDLQAAAVRSSAELREQDAMIAAQGARLDLARKAHLPDVDLTVQYGQRGGGLPDMVSATVSFPIPVFKGRKQDQQVAEASSLLVANGAERAARANVIRAEVARLMSEVERERTRLALFTKAILPQGRAALSSTTASYGVGKAEFNTILERQATVFTYETEYFRALSDFAIAVAELERVVGEEVMK